MDCLRCGAEMRFSGSEKFQLGRARIITGIWPNILSGALKVLVYQCPDCGKLEFFCSEDLSGGGPQVKCPDCGFEHDFDCPKCPKCGHGYYRDI